MNPIEATSTALSSPSPVFVTLFGLGTVFSVLIILYFLIRIIKLVFSRPHKPYKAEQPIHAPPLPVEDDTQLIAVLSAAVAAYLGIDQDDIKDIKVRHITSRTYEAHNAWSFAGRNDNIGSSF